MLVQFFPIDNVFIYNIQLHLLASLSLSLSEMKMVDILATLMKVERFKGRGKWDNKVTSNI